MKTYNKQPQPRVLAINFDQDEIDALKLEKLFPTVRHIEDWQLDGTRQKEYDVVICTRMNTTEFDEHLYILAVGGNEFSDYIKGNVKVVTSISHKESVAKEFLIDDKMPLELRQYAEQVLLPLFKDAGRNQVLEADNVLGMGHTILRKDFWQPLISDGDGKVLAGWFRRRDHLQSEQWFVPESVEVSDLHTLVDVLIARWSKQQPDMFSKNVDWEFQQEWRSPEERRLVKELDTLNDDFERLAKEHHKQIGVLKKSIKSAAKAADKNHRAILTTQGDALKNAVQSALEYLGFEVIDSDSTKAEKDDLLEDLVIRTTYGDKIWICLAEVRGYKRGAKQSDLQRIGRFVGRYEQAHGSLPDAAWYIVNHSIEKSPNERQRALAANPEDVKMFSNISNGLVIDTTDLFRLKKRVEDSELDAKDARKLLIECKGNFASNPGSR